MARSQIISQLIGQTLVQLSQCFHHPPSSYGDNYIIFAPSSPTAPVFSLLVVTGRFELQSET